MRSEFEDLIIAESIIREVVQEVVGNRAVRSTEPKVQLDASSQSVLWEKV